MTKPPTVATSGYLNRPLRTIEQAERDMSQRGTVIRRLMMSIPFLRVTK
jgi:hypothetical protein